MSENKVKISGVELTLSEPADIELEWIGDESYVDMLKAAWMVVDDGDLPLNPRILGKPGVGKTTLAYATGKRLGKPVYIFQATMDTRPEDLLISPVISGEKKITYVASSLVSAMIKGGVCLIDEANRMSEKSWASLAPLMDRRRYVDSIIAGIRIYAHEDFRICVTMNSDSSTYELPEYIQSRLNPKIYVEFPNKTDEMKILKYNVPFASDEIIEYCTDFLQNAHRREQPYVARDGINIIRYYVKSQKLHGKDPKELVIEDFKNSLEKVLEKSAIQFCPDEEVKLEKKKSDIPDSLRF
ncbi:MAG: AAA family ATPase [Promethearchaeia archaeon]